MTRLRDLELRNCAWTNFERLVKLYDKMPSWGEVEDIKQVIKPITAHNHWSFEPALLFFLCKSDLIYRKQSLLVGWITPAEGPKQEIWVKQREQKMMAYTACGGPPWLPATVVVMASSVTNGIQLWTVCSNSTPSVSASFSTPTSMHASPFLRNPTAFLLFRDTVAPTVQISRKLNRRRITSVTVGADGDSDMDMETTDYFNTTDESSAIEPTDLDIEVDQQTQELRNILQSKQVIEIEVMLAEKSGQLPTWIEKIAREELSKKKLRDLTMVKNLFG